MISNGLHYLHALLNDKSVTDQIWEPAHVAVVLGYGKKTRYEPNQLLNVSFIIPKFVCLNNVFNFIGNNMSQVLKM